MYRINLVGFGTYLTKLLSTVNINPVNLIIIYVYIKNYINYE